MAALWTIPETILYADIALPLCANYNSRGKLFGGTKAPVSQVTILMVTDALSWGYSGGAQTDQELRNVANYLQWLIGMWGQEAVAVVNGGSGGGSVIPPGGVTLKSPIKITGSDFVNATDWDGANSDGINILAAYTLEVFWNDVSRYLDEGTEWNRTGSGIEILIPGFDATAGNLTSIFYISISV